MDGEYIKLNRTNCKNCHRCIQHCPVKSISYRDGKANILTDECLLCGQCFVACPQNAKTVRSDRGRVEAHIKAGDDVYASLAPSFIANFRGATVSSMRKALRELGFADADETAIGASMVKTRYEELIAEGGQEVLISSCCPVVNDLVRMYHPEALPFLADVVTPAEAHCREIKRRHPDAVTVFIGPCIAKKKEADASSAIDIAITFAELISWLAEESVMLESIPDASDNSRARLFPTSNGILRTMKKADGWAYVSVDGMDNCKRAIKEIEDGGLRRCFVEMSACAGSCVGGPVMEKMRARPISDNALIYAYAGKKDFDLEQPAPEKLKANFSKKSVRRINIPDSEIEAVLKSLGKTTPDKELNCGFCGYDTCREKARAVCLGKAEVDMCLPYLMEKAQSFSDVIIDRSPNGLIVLDEALMIQQINKAACKMMRIKRASDMHGEPVVSILNPKPIIDAATLGKPVNDLPMYLAEYKRYVELTVVHDKRYKIILVLLHDITEPEAAKSKTKRVSRDTVEVADRVIENQMRTVQEIASLLGDAAAETKIALTKLKESLEEDE